MKRGFTLIELLIVIAIIGILATLVSANYMTSLKRANDAKRKSDLKELQEALELYKLDQAQSRYPSSSAILPNVGACWSSGSGCSGNMYMQAMVGDGSSRYSYVTNDNGDTYTLTACLEDVSDPDGTLCGSTCPSNKRCYIVNSP